MMKFWRGSSGEKRAVSQKTAEDTTEVLSSSSSSIFSFSFCCIFFLILRNGKWDLGNRKYVGGGCAVYEEESEVRGVLFGHCE